MLNPPSECVIQDNRSPEVNPVLFDIRETVAREWHYCACVFSLLISEGAQVSKLRGSVDKQLTKERSVDKQLT